MVVKQAAIVTSPSPKQKGVEGVKVGGGSARSSQPEIVNEIRKEHVAASDSKRSWYEQSDVEIEKGAKTWSDVAKGESRFIRGQKLEFIQPNEDGVVIIEEGNRLWEHNLVGYVLGQKPGC